MTEETPPKKRPGRPKGSTNKPRAASKTAEAPRAVAGEVIVPGEATQAELAVAVTTKVNERQVAKRLDAIATSINKEFGKGIDAQFAIGRLLLEARSLMPSDPAFGQWFDQQNFPFSRPTATRLRQAAEREDEVRAFIAERGESVREVSVSGALQALNVGAQEEGRVPREAQRRVKELLADVPAPVNGFLTWQAATEQLDLQTLTVEELGQFAALLKSLVDGYQAERARRTA